MEQDFGLKGALDFNVDKLLDESPEYYVFNGSVGALTGDGALNAETGESVRIFFGVGGKRTLTAALPQQPAEHD